MNTITTAQSSALTIAQNLTQQARNHMENSESSATQRAKRADIKIFRTWLTAHGLKESEAQASDVILFLTEQAQSKAYATVQRYKIHVLQYLALDFKDSEKRAIKQLMRGIGKNIGTQQKQAHALTVDELKALIDACDTSKRGLRNRAMLAVGFSCALRVSELCALRVRDIELLNDNQALVFIAKSKTDQSARGVKIALAQGTNIKALDILKKHIKTSNLKNDDLLFKMHVSRFAQIIAELAETAGIDGVTPHSLRAGLITAVASAGATIDKIKEVSRHKSTDVLLRYVRDSNVFNNHATAGVL